MPPGHPEPSSGSGAPRDLSALLVATASGEREAEERLLALTYDELHRLARSYLAQERPGHTLQPTALVNEAWMRLFGASGLDLTERGRFLSLAARAMRRVLVDHARARIREKRGGGGGRVPIDTSLIAPDRGVADVVAVDQALERLHALSVRQAEIVELRFFGGLDVSEVARTLSISPSTAEREWRDARAWLHAALGDPS